MAVAQPQTTFPCLQGLGVTQLKGLIAYLLTNYTTPTTLDEAMSNYACACVSEKDLWLFIADQLAASNISNGDTCDEQIAASKCWQCVPSKDLDKIILLTLGVAFSRPIVT